MTTTQQRPGDAFESGRIASNVYPMLRPLLSAGEGQFPVERVTAAFRGFLEALDLDLTDPNLAETADRVARAYREILSGLRSPEPTLSTFPNTKGYGGIVSLTNIPLYSICAHHFLPFFGAAHVGYVPGECLVGLSKVSRAVDFLARRPQLQEDLTEEIAALLDERLAPAGLIVSVQARHLCMEMRGVSRPGVTTKTVAIRGVLADERLQRQFFEGLRGSGPAASGNES